MTKAEAIQAMSEGKKVTHRYFSKDVWITIDPCTGAVTSGLGYSFSFIYRNIEEFDKGWSIFNPNKLLTFLGAVNSGKIVRSEYWNSCQSLDTRMFKEDSLDTIKDLVTKEAVAFTWREISGKWSIVKDEVSIYDL